MFYLKLRNNITLDSDLQLAEKEIRHLFGQVKEITRDTINFVSFLPEENVLSNVRDGRVIGYITDECYVPSTKLLLLLSFIQEIWVTKDNSSCFTNPYYCVSLDNTTCAIPLMSMSELLSYSGGTSKQTMKDIVMALSGRKAATPQIKKAILRKSTSAPLAHSLHTYKAKFFPRFVRSLIVSNIDLKDESLVVCDPYVGSGTTLVESSLMGFPSIGIDIDPLSCFISKTKTDTLLSKNHKIPATQQNIQNCPIVKYNFPEIIWKKFQRWGTENEGREYETEISQELTQISGEKGFYSSLHKLALSDALTKKFNIRMMGTGSGRFAMEIGKKPLLTSIKSNLQSSTNVLQAISEIEQVYQVKPAHTKVINEDATNRSIKDKSVDIIVTSPPYIPASSGREDYLVGKIISLSALKSLDDKFVQDFSKKCVGSMDNMNDVSMNRLPQSVSKLYNWLINDELRAIKAKPIVSYYNSLLDSLIEDVRTLKDDGTIIYIIGKETVFYNFSTKEIIYKVNCDEIFQELAESAGLKVIEQINIELDKKNVNARPRSTDKYYECAIILKKK